MVDARPAGVLFWFRHDLRLHDQPALQHAIALAQAKGAKRALLLPVSAPFHCALMQPAADVMRDALAQVQANAPVVPLVANVTADAAALCFKTGNATILRGGSEAISSTMSVVVRREMGWPLTGQCGCPTCARSGRWRGRRWSR